MTRVPVCLTALTLCRRPTFLPALRLKALNAGQVLGGRDPRKRVLAGYLAALADLAAPKQALRILQDAPRLKVSEATGGGGRWSGGALVAMRSGLHTLRDTCCCLQAYQFGIAAALRQLGPEAHALVLGAGGGMLSLLAAEAGAAHVTAVERSRMLYRMAKQGVEANAVQHAAVVSRVQLLDRRLQAVGVTGEALPPDAALVLDQRRGTASTGDAAKTSSAAAGEAGEAGEAAAATTMPRRAGLLVTDLLDHGVLGLGLLPALDYAADRLLAPGALVVPSRVQVGVACWLHRAGLTRRRGQGSLVVPVLPLLLPQVYAVLLELRVGSVNGFDLSALNAYWWHPQSERLDLSRLPYRRLSAPFAVHSLDLQARLDARLAGHSGARSCSNSSGDCEAGGDECKHGSSAEEGATVWDSDVSLEVLVTAEGQWNAVAFWFETHMDATSGSALTSWGEGRSEDSSSSGSSSGCNEAPPPAAAARSWEPAVQYLDSRSVVGGGLVKLRVRQDSGQYIFSTHPQQCRPRHALGETEEPAPCLSIQVCVASLLPVRPRYLT